MSIHKGGKILEELIKNTKGSNLKFHLFGTSEFKELEKNNTNYVYHGKYKREELPKLLAENNINLVCNFSIWAETYSYTLTEEIASKVPVLSFDIGAVGERINNNNLGWTIPITSNTNDIIDKINNIVTNNEEYEKVLNSINNYHIKTTEEMSCEYDNIYISQKTIKLNAQNAETLKNIIEANYKVTETISSAETAWILNSLKWKIVSKIKVPKSIKAIIRKAVK